MMLKALIIIIIIHYCETSPDVQGLFIGTKGQKIIRKQVKDQRIDAQALLENENKS